MQIIIINRCLSSLNNGKKNNQGKGHLVIGNAEKRNGKKKFFVYSSGLIPVISNKT